MSAPELDDPLEAARHLLSLADPLPVLAGWSANAERPALRAALVETARALSLGRRPPSPLRHVRLEVTFGARTEGLELLLLPSIFMPEAWSLTFLEGLLRKPLWHYQGKTLIEMGTGSGWISLALLRFTGLSRAVGLDLNPQAVLMARVNAALNDDGAGAVGPGLADRFEAHASDLLGHPAEQGLRADLIVGCIPQVIAPMADLQSAEGLADLGNYAQAQGLAEDRFGLGLNARALREALTLLTPGGSVTLNLAGRPGAHVISGMFLRRGYAPEILWRARVEQADDTDIAGLVDLEARAGQSFSFHLHRHSPEPVSARIARAVLSAGRPIFHELQVVEGRPRSEALAPLVSALDALDLSSLWEQLDLSASTDEQLRFVTRLAQSFGHSPTAPYPHEAGDLTFRQRVSDFLQKFHGLPLTSQEVFTGPDRPQLLQALLLCAGEPGTRVMISESLREAYGAVLAKLEADAIWVHGDLQEIVELVPLLRPGLVVIAPDQVWRRDREALADLLSACEARDAVLCIDESDRFEISSHTAENPILAFLGQHLDSPHLVVFFGLVRSQAFPDVHLSVLLSRQPRLLAALEVAAEVTYSRVSWFHQAYYESLFDELVAFRVNASAPPPPPGPARPGRAPRPVVAELLAAPAFARPAPGPGVLRLDYGENELPLPRRLMAGILRGFLGAPRLGRGSDDAAGAVRAACDYLRATRLPELDERQLLLGQGSLPLLRDALLALRGMLGHRPRVLLPRGSFGVIPPLLTAAGCDLLHLDTAAPEFLATPTALAAAPDFDVLLLTHPANPSGCAYAPPALAALIRLAAARGARVILDEVFGLLADLDGPTPTGQDRLGGLRANEARGVLLVCGASKEFAGGGLRLGLLATRDEGWLATIAAGQLGVVPRHVLSAAEALFGGFSEHQGEVDRMRSDLRERRDRLASGLRALGFEVSERHRGGLFLLVDPSPLAGGDPEGFILRMEEEAGVRMNTPGWSGLRDHARACFALPTERLDEALARLGRWLSPGQGGSKPGQA